MKRLTRAPVLILTILALTVSAHPRGQANTNQEVLNRARGAYYSLARKGFKGFKAAIEPNWEVILAESANPSTLIVFRAMQFSMEVDANGAATLTHDVRPDAARSQLQPTFHGIHADMQRLVAGFFNSWRIFMVNTPFPETEIHIENQDQQYNLSYTTQSGKVTIAMNRDLLITEWNLTGPTVKRTVKPQFQKTPEGLLLIGYHGVFDPVGEGIKTTLDFQIEYQDADGMKVPQKVRLNGMHGSEPVAAELVFKIKAE